MSGGESVEGRFSPDVEARIRARAHELWETEGRPTDRAAEHWARARREIVGTEAADTPAAQVFEPSEPAGLGRPGPEGEGAPRDAMPLAGVELGDAGAPETGSGSGGPALSLDLPASAVPESAEAGRDEQIPSGAGVEEGDPGAVGLGEHPSPDAAFGTDRAIDAAAPVPLTPDLSIDESGALPSGGADAAFGGGPRSEPGPEPRQGQGSKPDPEPGPRPRKGPRPGVEEGRAAPAGPVITVAAVALGALYLAVRKRRR